MALKRKFVAAAKGAVPAPALAALQSVSVSFRNNPHYRYMRWQKRHGEYAFIHINKCGGTSIETALDIPVKVHDTARQRCNKIGRDAWNRIFTFAVVRNPYDRVASLYRYRIRTNQTGLGDDRIDLNDWVREVWQNRNPAYVDQPIMFASCFEWVTDDDGVIMVDEIIKLEEIDTGWTKVSSKIDGPDTLPRANTTKSGTAPADALTGESRAIIRAAFSNDFRTFGYEA